MEIIDRDASTWIVQCENGPYIVRANSSQQAFRIYVADDNATSQLGCVLKIRKR